MPDIVQNAVIAFHGDSGPQQNRDMLESALQVLLAFPPSMIVKMTIDDGLRFIIGQNLRTGRLYIKHSRNSIPEDISAREVIDTFAPAGIMTIGLYNLITHEHMNLLS